MTEQNNAGKFTEGSIMKHVIVMTMTSAFGLTFTFLIEFLSLVWLAQLDNTAMKASVAISGNIMFLNISIAIALMIPAIALVSRSIGRGDLELARKQTTSSIIVACSILAIVSALLLIFLNPLIAYIGAKESAEVLAYTRTFLLFVLPTAPIFAAAMIASGVLRAEGDAFGSMMVTLSAGLVAMILDPLLIWYWELGVEGAAIVAVITRFVMLAVAYYYLVRKHNLLAPLRNLNIKAFLKPYFAIAVPALLTQISSPIGFIILTMAIAKFGESYLAAVAANMSALKLSFGGVFALSGAIGGIIGQNYGAGKLDRVRDSYIKAITFGIGYAVLTWVILMLLRPYIISLFKLDEAGQAFSREFIFLSIHFAFVSVLFVSNAAFNNLGRPFWSTATNWLRDIILTLPIVLLLTNSFGPSGVNYAQALVGTIVGIIAGIVGWRYLGKIARGEAQVERLRK